MAGDPIGFDQPKRIETRVINAVLSVNPDEPDALDVRVDGPVALVSRVLAAASDAVEDEYR